MQMNETAHRPFIHSAKTIYLSALFLFVCCFVLLFGFHFWLLFYTISHQKPMYFPLTIHSSVLFTLCTENTSNKNERTKKTHCNRYKNRSLIFCDLGDRDGQHFSHRSSVSVSFWMLSLSSLWAHLYTNAINQRVYVWTAISFGSCFLARFPLEFVFICLVLRVFPRFFSLALHILFQFDSGRERKKY